MKINKLMLTLAVAASAFAACNKQETTPVVNDNMGNKSIVMSIANVQAPTKSAGTSIADQTQVTLNNYQVFFSDGTYLYTPKTATAEEFTADSEYPWGTFFEATAGSEQEFHFLDNNVNRVVVVGNLDAEYPVENGKTKEADLWASFQNLNIKDQQNENDLILFGSDSDLKTTANHDSYEDQHPAPVYKALVNLMPAVARFEVTGYQYNEGADAEYRSVVMNNQSLIGFYDSAVISSTGETNWTIKPGTMSKEVVQYSWDDVYQSYFSKLTDADKAAWYYDDVNVTLAPSATATAAAPSETQNCYAYHVFPAAVPSFIFQITAKDANNIVTPMYLQTESLTGCAATKAGVVYQMVVKFDDSVLKAAEKCIDVEIFVHDWHVIVVTPEF